jgi:hypothetical protein
VCDHTAKVAPLNEAAVERQRLAVASLKVMFDRVLLVCDLSRLHSSIVA